MMSVDMDVLEKGFWRGDKFVLRRYFKKDQSVNIYVR